MIRLFSGLLLSIALLAEEAAPGIVRGTLVLAEGGLLEIRPVGGNAVRCGFDTRTWIERDHKRLQMDASRERRERGSGHRCSGRAVLHANSPAGASGYACRTGCPAKSAYGHAQHCAGFDLSAGEPHLCRCGHPAESDGAGFAHADRT